MRTRTRLAPLAAAAVVALATVAIGCGDDEQGTSASSRGGNAVDAAFVADMTAHHQGAIAMARTARKRGEHAEIRTLAGAIVTAQEREIATMRSLRADLPEARGTLGMSEEDMGTDMDPSMLDDADPFDRAFIDMMVPHHAGAVAMAERLLEDGEHPRLRAMAKEIVEAQTEEIARMRAWRKAWYGSAGASPDPMADHGH